MPAAVRDEYERLRQIARAEHGGGFPNAAYRSVELTDPAVVRGAVDDLDTRLAPARVEDIKHLLGWLSDRVKWPNELQDPEAAGRSAEILAEELAELPYEAVARTVRAYPKRNKWWPALADLYEPAEADATEMRRLRTNLTTLAKAAERGPDNRRVGNVTYHDPQTAARHREQRVDRGGFQPISASVKAAE